jgi:hypothetical protein
MVPGKSRQWLAEHCDDMNDRYRNNCGRSFWPVSRPHRKLVAESQLLKQVG